MSYKIKFVDPAKNYLSIKEEIDAAYHDVMSKGDLIARHQLKDFEDNLAAFVGTKYAVGLNSGYDALHLSLRAAGVGQGDEVIVPAHTFVASASAIVNVGARPVLVDVGPDFNINPELIESAIGPHTKAIMPVHLSGWMADMVAIEQIASKHDLVIVEDACQSLGAAMLNRRAGSWGLTGCWSFYPFKILGGYGDGGAITTNDPEVAQYAIRMRYNGEDRETGEYHGHGFTCLLDNLQAAFLDIKLKKLPAWIKYRQEIANTYRRSLEDLEDLVLPHYDDPRRTHVYQNYTVLSQQGDEFSDYLKANGVEVLTQFRKPYYRHQALELPIENYPQTELISAQVCSLPMNTELTPDDLEYVVSTVRRFYAK